MRSMAIALVQNKLNSTITANVNAVSPTTQPVAGNLIIAAISYFSSGSDRFSSLTDNASNTYTQIGSTRLFSSSNYVRLYYVKNLATAASFQTSLTFSAGMGSTDSNLAIYEYSGVEQTAPLDTTNPGATGTSATVTPGAVTPTRDNCLIFSVGADTNGNNATPTANTGGGYTLEDHQDDSTSHERFYTEDFIQGTAASTTASFTIAVSSAFGIQAGVFLEAVNIFDSATITEGITVATAGGTTLTPSVSDNINVSESITASKVTNVNIFDSITIAETVTASIVIPATTISVFDSVTISEATTPQKVLNTGTKFDSVNISESVSTTPVNARAFNVSDSVTISENMGIFQNYYGFTANWTETSENTTNWEELP